MHDGIFDVKHAHKLDNPERIKNLRPLEILKDIAKVSDGETCVDFGSGTGVFALPMAELVSSAGRVYAVDSSPEMLEHIKAKNPPSNLFFVNSDVRRSGLDNQIADVCLFAFILHEVKEPGNLVAEACRLLKPGGRLLIIEWKAELDSPGPPKHARISKERVMQIFDENNLTAVEYIDWSPNYYIVLGRKNSNWNCLK
jgi:ubiquinone/menaquinone biosynthesis C-methylase UbiE